MKLGQLNVECVWDELPGVLSSSSPSALPHHPLLLLLLNNCNGDSCPERNHPLDKEREDGSDVHAIIANKCLVVQVHQ